MTANRGGTECQDENRHPSGTFRETRGARASYPPNPFAFPDFRTAMESEPKPCLNSVGGTVTVGALARIRAMH
jgi:hypothetical protein